MRTLARAAAGALAFVALTAGGAPCQAPVGGTPATAATDATLVDARRLAAAGALAEAIALLEATPAVAMTADVHWQLATLHYWTGDHRRARRHFDVAAALRPEDAALVLDRARFLMDIGELRAAAAAARGLLGPVLDGAASGTLAIDATVAADAAALLGTLAWWTGDLAGAERWFRRAAAGVPGHGGARSGLAELRGATAGVVHLTSTLAADDQPRRGHEAGLDARIHVAPAWQLHAAAASTRAAGAAVAAGSAGLRGMLWPARLELGTAAGGARLRSARGGTQAAGTWDATAAFRLPAQTRARATHARLHYTATLASLDTLLLHDRTAIALERDVAGWGGAVVLRTDRFPDGNTVTAAYAWLLAPLAPGIRTGAALAHADAARSTWQPRAAVPLPAGVTVPGRYAPYYTPAAVRTASVLAELAVARGEWHAQLNGAWAPRARERAPVLIATEGGAAALYFYDRRFSPHSARLLLQGPLAGGWTLRLTGERQATAYYRANHGMVTLTRHVTGWSPVPVQ
jgi:hypothetical protein